MARHRLILPPLPPSPLVLRPELLPTLHNDVSSNLQPPPISDTTPTPFSGEGGLGHTPSSSSGLSRANAQCLALSCPFSFQDLLGHLGQGREAQRQMFRKRDCRSFAPLTPWPGILFSAPSKTPPPQVETPVVSGGEGSRGIDTLPAMGSGNEERWGGGQRS